MKCKYRVRWFSSKGAWSGTAVEYAEFNCLFFAHFICFNMYIEHFSSQLTLTIHVGMVTSYNSSGLWHFCLLHCLDGWLIQSLGTTKCLELVLYCCSSPR